MKVPFSWLCDFAEFGALEGGGQSNSPSDDFIRRLVDAMNDLGLVVEGVERVGEGLDKVVVAQVLKISPIEGADKIRRIMVAADEEGELQIVCGAFNFDVGDKVPLAKIGAVLPGGFEIARRKMRSVDSFGMLCSASELRLGTDQSGLLVLPRDAEVGAPIAISLGITEDVVFDLAIENNRPDANCILGVARDLAAWFHLPLSVPRAKDVTGTQALASETLSGVNVECPEQCDRFLVALFDATSIAQTPGYIKNRLTLAGMRPVSLAVDLSNYLMLELGQPSHPYDVSKVDGGAVSVRLARAGESIELLDAVKRTLGEPDAQGRESLDVVIVDQRNFPVGLAGIMGGNATQIEANTSSILLEIAHFSPMAIARTSKRLGIRTEASARFERGVDPRMIELTLSRFTDLYGATPIAVVEVSSNDVLQRVQIEVRHSEISRILGVDISLEDASRMLIPLGFDVIQTDKYSLRLQVPTNRPDIEREIDVVEEIARHFGYRNIPKTRPSSKVTGRISGAQGARRRLGYLAVDLGFYEAWTQTLLAPGEQEKYGDPGPFLEVENPLAREESVLRRSLLAGLVRTFIFNARRREPELRFYEIGKVFSVVGEKVIETERLAFLLARETDAADTAMSVFASICDELGVHDVTVLNAYDVSCAPLPLREAVSRESWHGLHPNRSGLLLGGDVVIGQIGEIDPEIIKSQGIDAPARIGYLEIDFNRIMSQNSQIKAVKPVSPFPAAQVDLAFEVPNSVSAWEVARVLSDAGEEINAVKLFDVFRNPSMADRTRSLAFSVNMSAMDRTLSDADISAIRQTCIALVETRFRAKLRS